MSVEHIQQYQLDAIWPHVEKYITAALDTGRGEMNAAQARYGIVKGLCELFVSKSDDEITGAALVEFVNYPNYRVANVIAIGGRGLYKEKDDFISWLKFGGASYFECHCNEVRERLFRTKYGMEKSYSIMRSAI